MPLVVSLSFATVVAVLSVAVNAAPPSTGTCDECTVYQNHLWCPVDLSCLYINMSGKTVAQAIDECSQKCEQKALNIAAFEGKNPPPPQRPVAGSSNIGGGSVSVGGSFTRIHNYQGYRCLDLQTCFYSNDQCSDCLYARGTWCPSRRECYVFHRRPESSGRNDIVVPTEYICEESCGGECTTSDSKCPACERFRPAVYCGALLPMLLISSCGTVIVAVMIALFAFKFYNLRRRERERAAEEERRKESRRRARQEQRSHSPKTRNNKNNRNTNNNHLGTPSQAEGDISKADKEDSSASNAQPSSLPPATSEQ